MFRRHSLLERKYDVAIIAPGPTVNELTYCVPSRHGGNVSMVWFGVSATRIAWKHTYHKHKYCLKFIAVREEISYVNIAQVGSCYSSYRFISLPLKDPIFCHFRLWRQTLLLQRETLSFSSVLIFLLVTSLIK